MRSKRSNGYDDAFMKACAAELRVTPEDLAAGEFRVAIAGGIRGFVRLDRTGEPSTAEIGAFFVEPGLIRRGIGTRLWAAVLRSARSQGLDTLRLDADPAAVAFYQKLGFLVVGEAPSGSIHGRRLPRMEFRLI